ncbi:hypothetical protein G6F60_014503 [Rhizopus arrhizus]|nr:hypothetical protein G6F60_014503 [Rhizopus arrhizus]
MGRSGDLGLRWDLPADLDSAPGPPGGGLVGGPQAGPPRQPLRESRREDPTVQGAQGFSQTRRAPGQEDRAVSRRSARNGGHLRHLAQGEARSRPALLCLC